MPVKKDELTALEQAVGIEGLSPFLIALLIELIKFAITYFLENMEQVKFQKGDRLKKIAVGLFLRRLRTSLESKNFNFSDFYSNTKDALNIALKQ